MLSKLKHKFQQLITRAWYRRGPSWIWLLMPLEWLVLLVVKKRFKNRTIVQATPPVIIVGNITVGGTGKTPCVQALIEWAKTQGLQPGVISRGYGAATANFPILITSDTDVTTAGDEAKMLADTTGVPVVIDHNRARALDYLKNYPVNIVISDDGLQHYPLPRNIEIAVIDGQRLLGNGHCLPVGPLREPKWRLETVDLILQNGGCNPYKSAQLFNLRPCSWVNVKTGASLDLIELDKSVHYHAVAGIGNPGRFFQTLKELGIRATSQSFPDHHDYSEQDFYFANGDAILMTEKDAIKCIDFAPENWWYLKVIAEIPESALQKITQLLPTPKVNS